MLGAKMQTLLAVVECKNFTKAAQALSLTQPAVSHHISQLEEELGATLLVRANGGIRLTPQGEIAVKYARRLKAVNDRLHDELADFERNITRLRVGITHTSETNLTTEVLAKCGNLHEGLNITIRTGNIRNLYDMLSSYELDLAIVEGSESLAGFSSMMLDTDYLVCVMSINNPLSKKTVVTLNELKREQMILRLPTSATRNLFESALRSSNDSISNYNVILEVDNIATIKDLIRKDLGVSILPKSACMDELKKGKICVLPVENLSMVREIRIVYPHDFTHLDILNEITRLYRETAQ